MSDPNLKIYFPLDTTARNAADNAIVTNAVNTNLNGIIQGNVQIISDNIMGDCLSFNGSDAYIQLPEMDIDYSQGITVEAWISFEDFGSWSRIIDFGNGENSDNIILAHPGTGRWLGLYIRQGAVDKGIDSSQDVFALDSWTHITATVDGSGQAKLYKDGIVIKTGSLHLPLSIKRSKCYIGKSNWPDALFKGKMAHLQLYNRALSEAEVLVDLEKNAPSAKSLYFPLNAFSQDADGNNVVKDANSDIVAKVEGSLKVVSDDLMKDCVAFDGSSAYAQLPELEVYFGKGITVEAWVCFEDFGNWSRIIDFGNGENSDNILLAHPERSRKLCAHIKRGGVSQVIESDEDVFDVNTWAHVALTINASGEAKLYKNGIVIKASAVHTPFSTRRSKCYIGKSNWPDALFKGKMAHLKIHSKVLSEAEILADMKAHLVSKGENCLQLDGVKDYASVPDYPLLNIDSYTVELWIYPEGRPSEAWKGIIGKPGRNFNIWLHSNGLIHHRFHDGRAWNAGIPDTPNNSIKWNKWNHVAITNNGTTAKTYINGELMAEGRVNNTLVVDTGTIYIGRNLDGSDKRYFKGKLEEIRIWNKARKKDEIQADMNRSLNGDEIGLVAYYRLNEGSGTIELRDATQNGHNGLLRPGLRWVDSDAPVTDLTQKKCLQFDGCNDFISVKDSEALRVKAYTVELWVYPQYPLLEGWRGIIGKPGRNFQIWLMKTGQIYHRFRTTRTTNAGAPDSLKYAVKWEEWNHVAITNDGVTAKTYVNGVLMAEGPTRGELVPNTSDLYIGCNPDGANNSHFKGKLDDIRIWNKARSQDEIKADMKRCLNGNEDALVLYYRIDEDSGSSILHDATGNGHDVRLHYSNFSWVASSAPISKVPATAVDSAIQSKAAYFPLDKVLQDSNGNAAVVNVSCEAQKGVIHGATFTNDVTVPIKKQITFARNCIAFDGKNDYAFIPDHEDLRITSYTVELWVFPIGVPSESWKGIIGKPGRNFNIWLHSNGYVHHRFHNGKKWNAGVPNTPNYSIKWNRWNHIAITNDGSEAKTYINGKLMAEGPTQGTLVTKAEPIYIACHLDDGKGGHFKGKFTEIRIWNKARSEADIFADMNKELKGDEEGLLVYYPLNESRVGKGLVDATGNGHNGVLKPGIQSVESDAPVSQQDNSAVRECLQFDGVTDCIADADSEALRLNAYTVELWAYPEGRITGTKGLIGKPGRNFNIWLFANGLIHHRFRTDKTTNAGAPNTPVNSVKSDTWTHIAITNDGTTAKTYINGELKAEGPTGGKLLSNISNFYIGCNMDSGNGNYFKGKLDEIRIWNKARSESDINANMKSALKGDEDGLVLYYHLDENNGEKKMVNVTGNGHHIDLFHYSHSWGKSDLLFGGPSTPNCFAFDGIDDYIDCESSLSDSYTKIAWIKQIPGNTYCNIISGTSSHTFYIADGKLSASHKKADGIWITVEDTVVLAPEVWTHVAITYDSQQKKMNLYKDGVPVNTLASVDSFDSSDRKIQVGRFDGKDYFKGCIAHVSIYSSVLTEEEVKQNKDSFDIVSQAAYQPKEYYFALDVVTQNSNGENIVTNSIDDSSTGVVNGAQLILNKSLPVKDPSIHGSCLEFDGIDDYVDCGDLLYYSYTKIAWVRYIPGDQQAGIISGADTHAFFIADGKLAGEHKKGDGTSEGVVDDSDFPVETWVYVALTYDYKAQKMSLYRDGVLVKSANDIGVFDPVDRKVQIGRFKEGNYFKGSIAHVHVYDRVLSALMIEQDKASYISPFSIEMHLPLNAIENNEVMDAKNINFNGSVKGEAQIIDDDTFGKCLSFDGVDDYVQLSEMEVDYSSGITIQAWVYFEDFGSWSRIIDFGNGENSDNILFTHPTTTKKLLFDVRQGTHLQAIQTSEDVLEENVWINVTATIDADGQAKLYKNGALIYAGSVHLPLSINRTKCYIGKSNWANALFKGKMAHIRLYNKSLSDQEIQANIEKDLFASEVYFTLDTITPDINSNHSIKDIVSNETKAVVRGAAQKHDITVPIKRQIPAGLHCIQFDGMNDYITIADSESLRITTYTVELWVYPEGVPSEEWKGIIGKPGRNFHVWLHYTGAVHHRFHTSFGTNMGIAQTPVGSVKWDEWNHIAITNDGSFAKTYINGELMAEGPTSGTLIADANTIYIARNLDGGDASYFKGKVDEIRIWNKARTQTEVKTDMHQSLKGNEADLVTYYRLDSGSGIKVLSDATSNESDGVLESRLSWAQSDVPITEESNTAQNCIQFDGINDYASIEDEESLQITAYTVELWLYPDGVPSEPWKGIFGKTGCNFNIWLHNYGSIHHKFHTHNNTEASIPGTPVGSIKWNEWNHIAITNDGSTAKTYINGQLMAEGATNGTLIADAGIISIARNPRGIDSSYFKGKIDEIRIWDFARSLEAIQGDMGRSLQGDEENLLAYYPMDDATGTTSIIDTTGNGHDATLESTLTWVDSDAPVHGASSPYCLEFDGVDDFIDCSVNLSDSYTKIAWVRPIAGNAESNIISGVSKHALSLKDNKLSSGHNGAFTAAQSVNPVSAETWIHVAATYDKRIQTMTLYEDSKKVSSVENVAPFASSDRKLQFGKLGDSGYFKGCMAHIHIYNRALTENEIEQDYQSFEVKKV